MHHLQRTAAFVLATACNADTTSVPSGPSETSATSTASVGDGSTDTSVSGSSPTADDGAVASTGASTGGDGLPKYDLGFASDLPSGPEYTSCESLRRAGPTSLGCEFWAVDLDFAGNEEPGLGIGLGNPGLADVEVVIEDMRGPGDTLRVVGEFVVGAGNSEMVTVNGATGILAGQEHASFAGLAPRAAFRVTSDKPITAMQINPVGGAAGVVPEASLLLPTTALVGTHLALGHESGASDYVKVVATQDGTTVSTIAGDVMLDAFDVYGFPDPAVGGWEATGFYVTADAPIAMFSGNTCATIGGHGWCDHIEEQVLPLSAWGTHYVGAMHPQRTPPGDGHESVVWRVVAATGDTSVTISPDVVGGPIHIGDAGGYVEFTATEHFVATSDDDHPFMLVQYMTGGEALLPDCTSGIPSGDPWMLQMVPTAQWLETLPFSTDTSYVRDFVSVVRPSGTTVTLACFGVIPDARFEAIGDSGYEIAAIDLDLDGSGGEGECADGQQLLTADAAVGVYVGGIDCAASYAYPGGLSVAGLWEPPNRPPG